MIRGNDNIEVPNGGEVVIVSFRLHCIALGVPNVLFMSLKHSVTGLWSLQTVPSFPYSMLMTGPLFGRWKRNIAMFRVQ